MRGYLFAEKGFQVGFRVRIRVNFELDFRRRIRLLTQKMTDLPAVLPGEVSIPFQHEVLDYVIFCIRIHLYMLFTGW